MKLGNRSVIALHVFDEWGTKVAYLDSLKESKLVTSDEEQTILYVKDALMDTYLLEFITNEETDLSTDYESFFKKKAYRTFSFKKTLKKCKLIAETEHRNSKNGRDHKTYFEIPNAQIASSIDFYTSSIGEPSDTDIMFIIEPFNEDNELFKIHIEEYIERESTPLTVHKIEVIQKDYPLRAKDLLEHVEKILDTKLPSRTI
ncbi:hypothetical protein [Paenibacillus illinoisensis]|uniref:Uncharacterized protein n=1 Tax=Paenibacillus illinoisensis TaxID=59845 RepID=A0A2W0C825_9BACL|nr:hypothetical protein [Paenibacillus illinoisensis]PYY28187.1 Uncharacterized protein PIL02S_03333 [Paenibacillus illinoisensis]